VRGRDVQADFSAFVKDVLAFGSRVRLALGGARLQVLSGNSC
jgi:hypothetical protein